MYEILMYHNSPTQLGIIIIPFQLLTIISTACWNIDNFWTSFRTSNIVYMQMRLPAWFSCHRVSFVKLPTHLFSDIQADWDNESKQHRCALLQLQQAGFTSHKMLLWYRTRINELWLTPQRAASVVLWWWIFGSDKDNSMTELMVETVRLSSRPWKSQIQLSASIAKILFIIWV